MRSFLHTGPAGALLAALALVAAAPAGALELSPSEQAGKRIFRSGESPSGNAIIVKLGRDGATLPGSAAPCSSCHGADGQGRPEGGVRPSSIIWSEL
ncbi:MAG: ABC transporter substrate-binding protein, partial [Deltaproteobacteria bacterium]